MASSQDNRPQTLKAKKKSSRTMPSKYGSITDERNQTNKDDEDEEDSNEQSSSTKQDDWSDENEQRISEHELTLKDIQDVKKKKKRIYSDLCSTREYYRQ